ncbi:Protein of unknown function [Oceanospirillum multiglobuliferum]|uniref:DUF3037 domain-containing protein n=1 Tax=Oceanospirillum multiglobuliferum TaxID=64969 RepID=A0A1T4M6S1_9GAMM|nr:DUF3037 domain-containing protein [Oceanospirillum multiglobuliferum]OPX56223.1 hypothetical protein BTE48_04400 [Oceanospirillum multiglobuliferum]SJZ62699.1 Protein of unknown function [Oceanospirillum multiglobuliferum]
MKKFACQYKIVRFMPFLETGEFANIGILLFCPSTSQLEFRLAPARFGRVTQFFTGMEVSVYKEIISTLGKEFDRTQKLMAIEGGTRAKDIFNELSRSKGGVVHFSDTRVLMASSLKQTTDELYNHFVGRSFNTKKYRETILVQNLRNTLKQVNLDHVYKEAKINAGLINISLPFVHQKCGVLKGGIKPIAFDQSTVERSVKHADSWLSQAEHLVDADIDAKDLLFTLDFESVNDRGLERYIRKFQDKLSELGIETANAKDECSIIKFAREH